MKSFNLENVFDSRNTGLLTTVLSSSVLCKGKQEMFYVLCRHFIIILVDFLRYNLEVSAKLFLFVVVISVRFTSSVTTFFCLYNLCLTPSLDKLRQRPSYWTKKKKKRKKEKNHTGDKTPRVIKHYIANIRLNGFCYSTCYVIWTVSIFFS